MYNYIAFNITKLSSQQLMWVIMSKVILWLDL